MTKKEKSQHAQTLFAAYPDLSRVWFAGSGFWTTEEAALAAVGMDSKKIEPFDRDGQTTD